MGGKSKIRDLKDNKNINIRKKYAPAVFERLNIKPETSYLMDVKKAIFKLYKLGEPDITAMNPQKTLAEQRPNNAYGIKITDRELDKLMQLFGLTGDDWFQENIGGRITNDILSKKIDTETMSFVES